MKEERVSEKEEAKARSEPILDAQLEAQRRRVLEG